MENLGLSTLLLHHPYTPPAGFAAVQAPAYRASTVFFDSVADLRNHDWKENAGYSYGLHGNPASFMLEQRIASLEGGRYCTLYPSGLAAIAQVLLSLLKSGDAIAIPDNSYGPTLRLAQGELAKFGVQVQIYDPMHPDDLAQKMNVQTRLVWLEAPGSISMEFPPLDALLSHCHARGVTTVLDNTWGAGLAIQAFTLGVDICVHALTKYPSGGADLLMGSVTTQRQDLHLRIKQGRMHLGTGVASEDIAAVLKGLASLELRYAAQDQSARRLARFLAEQGPILELLHPALQHSKSSADSHANWRRICGATPASSSGNNAQGTGAGDAHARAAGIFSVRFQPQYTQDQIDRFCENLRLFKLGYSWGGPISLVLPYQMEKEARLDKEAWQEDRGRLVRFAIGLENSVDLEQDLAQALAKL